MPPQQAISNWLIDRDEFDPGRVISRIAKPKQQARAGGWCKCHGRFLSLYTIESGERYTAGRIPCRGIRENSDGSATLAEFSRIQLPLASQKFGRSQRGG